MGCPVLKDQGEIFEAGFQFFPIAQDEAQCRRVAFGAEAIVFGGADDDLVVSGFEVKYSLNVP